MTPFETAAFCANLADTKKAKDTLLLDTEPITSLADYFVITSVESRTQMRALAEEMLKAAKHAGIRPLGTEIDHGGRWTVLDFGDVIVHLFHHEDRQYYQLERFWNHATEIPRESWLYEYEQRQAS